MTQPLEAPNAGPKPLDIEALQALVRSVNLTFLRTTRGTFQLVEFRPGDMLNESVDVQASIRAERFKQEVKGMPPMLLRVEVVFTADLKSSAEPGRLVARVECGFALDYQVRDQELLARLGEAELAQFGRKNGVHNAWSYFREFCQTATARMGLPGMVIGSMPPLP